MIIKHHFSVKIFNTQKKIRLNQQNLRWFNQSIFCYTDNKMFGWSTKIYGWSNKINLLTQQHVLDNKIWLLKLKIELIEPNRLLKGIWYLRKVASLCEQIDPVSTFLCPKYIKFYFQNLGNVRKDKNGLR